jgi:hypothetical protein
VADGALLDFRRDDQAVRFFRQCLVERGQTARVNAVVIGQ